MRTIKFRGKRIDNGEWVYGDLVHGAWDGSTKKIEVGIQQPGCYAVAIKHETIGQYVGMGAGEKCEPIYVDDILYYVSIGFCVVIWNDDECKFQVGGELGNLFDINSGILYGSTPELVSNIFDCDKTNLLQAFSKYGFLRNEITGNIHDKKAKSCNKPCSPSDMHKGGKCDLNGCYED